MLKDEYKVYEEKMKKSIESVMSDFDTVRAGRANASVLNRISVDYYGTPTPIQQVASVAVSEARTLTITPWDRTLLRPISKAIMASDVGITPIDDGQTIRLNFPAPTEERRRELVKECASKAPFANLSSVCWTKIFLASVFRTQAGSAAVLRAARDESTRADCGAILQYIQQNYRTVRLSTLARAFHYNETYLSRMLQNYMGMSFTEIVRGIKMTRAEEYLSTSTLRIHDISALVGYDSVDHFSRTFKSTHNMSPQAYRRLTTKRGLRTLAASAVKGESAEKNAKTEKE